jgi:hypothetical protein
MPNTVPPYLFVNLQPPQGVDADSFELTSGSYAYQQGNSDQSASTSGPVELTVGMELGWWTAKFPYENKPVRLTLQDNKGNSWRVLPFYPNYSVHLMVATQVRQKSAAVPWVSPTLEKSVFAAEQQMRFDNYAKPFREVNGRTYYKWRVFLNEPDQVLKRIAEVEYLLHPTFPQPLQVRTNSNDKFAVEASGWGEFWIQITVKFKDQSTVRTSYYLDLHKRWP